MVGTNWRGPGGRPAEPPLAYQPACKPGSVARRRRRVTAIPLGRRLPGASSNLPGRPIRTPIRAHPLARRRARAVPIWSCSRWGLPCRFRCRKRGALLPHRFTLTRRRPCAASAGGLFSVALSLRLPPRRTLSGTACPWSPDFPLEAAFRHWSQAAVRPTDVSGMEFATRGVKPGQSGELSLTFGGERDFAPGRHAASRHPPGGRDQTGKRRECRGDGGGTLGMGAAYHGALQFRRQGAFEHRTLPRQRHFRLERYLFP